MVNQGDNIKNRIELLATHHLFYSLSVMMNFVTVTVYWNLLHERSSQKKVWDQGGFFTRLFNGHVMPGLCCLTNTLITNSVLSPMLVYHVSGFVLCYTIINFCQTRIMGKPVYHIFPWNDIKTPLLFVTFNLVFSFAYLGLVKIDQLLKTRGIFAGQVFEQ